MEKARDYIPAESTKVEQIGWIDKQVGKLTSRARNLLLAAGGFASAGCDPQGLDFNFVTGNKNPDYLALVEGREAGQTQVGPFQGWAFGSANVVLFGADPIEEARDFNIKFYRNGQLIEGFSDTLLPMESNLNADLPEGIRTGDTMRVESNGKVLRDITVDLFEEIEPIVPVE